jgi:hypothetical protein
MTLTAVQYKALRHWLRRRSFAIREAVDVCIDPERAAKLTGLAEGFEEIYRTLLLGPEFIESLVEKKEE